VIRVFAFGLLTACALAVTACGDSESASSGLGEPIRVSNGQFFSGSFPTSHDSGPAISQLMVRNTVPSKVIFGSVASSAQTVALGLENAGSGYWLVPVGAPDLAVPGTFSWTANVDFSVDVPAGIQSLLVAASDEHGAFGPQTKQNISVKSLLPTGTMVASLTWGADADLDLHLITPGGRELFSKRPNTIGSDETGKPLAGSGLLDRDSIAACVPDGVRTENVVWTDAPEAGTYLVKVDMFSACGKPAASFKFNLYVDGTSVLERTGRLLDMDADGGGAGSGLFVAQFTCDEGTGTCS
jgi:hypothetical protein